MTIKDDEVKVKQLPDGISNKPEFDKELLPTGTFIKLSIKGKNRTYNPNKNYEVHGIVKRTNPFDMDIICVGFDENSDPADREYNASSATIFLADVLEGNIEIEIVE